MFCRLVTNRAYRPSGVTFKAAPMVPPAIWLPFGSTSTRVTTPVLRSLRKRSRAPLVSPGTRSAREEKKKTWFPSAVTASEGAVE